jgi:hypothetical protein
VPCGVSRRIDGYCTRGKEVHTKGTMRAPKSIVRSNAIAARQVPVIVQACLSRHCNKRAAQTHFGIYPLRLTRGRWIGARNNCTGSEEHR